MPILTLTVTIVGGLIIVYLGANILTSFAVALLTVSVAVIAGMIGFKLFSNLRNSCDLFNFKKC